MFVTLLGLFAVISVNVPYWNWYGFPTTFTLAELADQLIGSALAGAAIGAIVKPAKPQASSTAA